MSYAAVGSRWWCYHLLFQVALLADIDLERRRFVTRRRDAVHDAASAASAYKIKSPEPWPRPPPLGRGPNVMALGAPNNALPRR